MKKFIYFFLFLLLSFVANSQTQPSGLPSPRSDSGFAQYNWVRALKGGFIFPSRDTSFTPTYIGSVIYWANPAGDSSLWILRSFTGQRWARVVTLSGGVSSGTVTSVATNTATGIAGGNITTTGTLFLDTTLISTRAWRQKGVDSLLGVANTKLNISDTGTMLNPYLRKTDTAAMLSNYVPNFRTITTNSPLFGGGNLSTNRTFGIDTGRAVAQVVTGGSLTAVKDSLLSVIASSGGGTVLSVSTTNGFGINSSVINSTSTPDITISVDTFAVSTRAWRNKGVDSAISVIPLRITDSLAAVNRIKAGGSGGVVFQTNTGNIAFSYGGGGSQQVDFHGFAGYDANRSSTYTDRSFVDKRYADSSLALRLLLGDTATMLSPYRRKTTLIENSDLRNSAITINGSSTALGGSISVGTVTSVAASAGTGISVSGSPITSSGTLTITNTAPDQTVTLTNGGNITITGTYPNFTLTNGVTNNNQLTNGAGYLTSADIAGKLNISDTASMLSNYRRKTTLIENTDLRNSAITINGNSTALGGSISVGTVTSVAASAGTGISVSGSPITSNGTLTITNTAPDQTVTLTAGTGISVTGTYPNFTVTNTSPSSGGTVTSVTASAPLSSSGGTTPNITISQATTSTNGFLSSTDWNTFNNKQAQLNGTGFVRFSGTTPSYITGTSSQFVKADGTLDGTSYATAASISGTTNYIPKFTSSSAIGNSGLFESSTAIGYNTTSPVGGGGAGDRTFAINSNSGSASFLTGMVNGTRYSTLFTSSSAVILETNAAIPLSFNTNNVERGKFTTSAFELTVPINGTSLSMSGGANLATSSGNVGVGGSPSASSAAAKVVQLRNFLVEDNTNGYSILRYNDYYDGTNDKYISNGAASAFQMSGNVFNWYQAASGTAGNNIAFSNTMRLESDGALLIAGATTDGTNKLIVNGGVKASGIINANSATTASNGSINVESTDPAIRYRVTGGTANARIYEWRAVASGGANDIMQLRLWNDAQSSPTTLMTVSSTGAATFSSTISARGAFSTYVADGLFGASALPSKILTPSGSEILFGYWDNGAGGYFPRIGFKGATNWAMGIASDNNSFLINVGNGGASTTGLGISSTGVATFNSTASTVINATSSTTNSRINFTHSSNGGLIGYANLGAGAQNNVFYVTTGSGTIGSGMNIDNNGATVFASTVTATGFFESSDLRLKNIVKRDGDVVYFNWKNGDDKKLHIGYIAQEVQRTNPDQVKADDKGFLSVNYTEVLVQKVRELERKLEKLERELKTNSKKDKTKN